MHPPYFTDDQHLSATNLLPLAAKTYCCNRHHHRTYRPKASASEQSNAQIDGWTPFCSTPNVVSGHTGTFIALARICLVSESDDY